MNITIALILALAPVALVTGCAQQEYLRGYSEGLDHQQSFCEATRRITNLECESDLIDTKAQLEIAKKLLEMCRVGKQ